MKKFSAEADIRIKVSNGMHLVNGDLFQIACAVISDQSIGDSKGQDTVVGKCAFWCKKLKILGLPVAPFETGTNDVSNYSA